MDELESVNFRHATGRNTKAYIINFDEHGLFISYETVVGYAGPFGRFRLKNYWGPTTGRHMNEMGIRDFETISDDDMALVLDNITAKRVPNPIKQ